MRTETVNQPVELKREEIVIERTPAGGPADGSFDENEIYIPLRREEVVVEKKVNATEDIRIGKRTEVDRKQVSETVRKEDVEIEQQGQADRPARGRTPSR